MATEAVSTKFFFLVAGFDYFVPDSFKPEKLENHGLNFEQMCRKWLYNRIKLLENNKNESDEAKRLGVKPPATLIFLYFDVSRGTIKAYKHLLEPGGGRCVYGEARDTWQELSTVGEPVRFVMDLPKGRVLKPRVEHVLTPGEKRKHFDWDEAVRRMTKPEEHPQNIMSILDVYRAARKAPEGSILDLSVFSHGIYKGPVLLNCNERPEYKKGGAKGNDRDPRDFDGRGRKDFNEFNGEYLPENQHRDNLAKFTKAFDAKYGVFRIWGCNANDKVRDLIKAINKKTINGPLKKYPSRETPVTVEGSGSPKTRPFGSWQRLVFSYLSETYAYLAAVNTKVTACAMPLGSGTDTDEENDQPLLERLLKINNARKEIIDFYYKAIGLSRFDPRDPHARALKDRDTRWYGKFEHDALERLRTELSAFEEIPREFELAD